MASVSVPTEKAKRARLDKRIEPKRNKSKPDKLTLGFVRTPSRGKRSSQKVSLSGFSPDAAGEFSSCRCVQHRRGEKRAKPLSQGASSSAGNDCNAVTKEKSRCGFSMRFYDFIKMQEAHQGRRSKNKQTHCVCLLSTDSTTQL